MLILHDNSKTNKYPLDNYKNYYVESILKSGDRNLGFSIPLSQKYANLISEQSYIENEEDFFVVKSITDTNGNKQITAKLDLEDLEGKEWENFESVEQTIADCMRLAIAGTGWTVGICNITKKRTIRKTICSALDIISQCRKTYRAEIEYKTKEKVINIYKYRGSDKGSFLMDTLNLKKLDVQGNTYDFYTRLVALGGVDSTGKNIKCVVTNNNYSNKVKSTIWKDERYSNLDSLREDAQAKLDEMAKPYKSYRATPYPIPECNIGDTITIISKELKINEKLRVISIKHFPEEVGKDTIEVANSILSFIDIQKEFQEAKNTVQNITSDNGTVSPSAVKGAFESFNKVNIQEFNAVKAKIGILNVNEVIADELHARKADIDKLSADKADVKDLTAKNISFSTASGEAMKLQDLLAQFISGNMGQFLNLTTQNTTIANAVIKNAMIDTVSADKINSGEIDTNLVKILSESGNLVINDNTIQIKDNSDVVRVQIGKDGNNDYSMCVWDSNGNLMFDATGIKDKAIKDKIIRNDMVSDTANISGSKLDINSVITEMNDNGTETIKGSKIKLDNENQTLDVIFNEMKEDVESNTTSLTAQQGKITELITNTTIVEDGETVQLKDKFAQQTTTVDGISAKVGAVEIAVKNDYYNKENVDNIAKDLKDKYDAVSAKQTSIDQTADDIKIRIDKIENGGTSKVATKVVTIDDSGITVGESTTPFTSTIDTTGMYLKSYDTLIATYNKDGAILKDLTVQGEITTGNLKILNVNDGTNNRTHIHFIG